MWIVALGRGDSVHSGGLDMLGGLSDAIYDKGCFFLDSFDV